MRLEHLRDKQAELAIAQYSHPGAFGDLHLIQDFASSRKGFDEYGMSAGDRGGNATQVADGQRQELTERSGVLDDAEYGSRRAVAAEAAPAPIAVVAREINFADDPFPNPRLVGGFCYLSHEFVAGRAREAVVSALKLKISGADSRGQQTNPGESFWNARHGLLTDFHAARLQVNG